MKAILRAGQFLQRRRSKDALDLEITSTHGDDSLGIERGLSIKANGQEIVGMRVGTHGHVHLAVKMLTANPMQVVCCGDQNIPSVGIDPERKAVIVGGPGGGVGSHTALQRESSPRDGSEEAARIETPMRPEEAHAIETRERLTGWITEGQHVFSLLPRLLDEHGELTARVEAAARECERLEKEVRVLRSENDSFRKQRTRMAEAFGTLSREFLVEPESEKGR